MFQALDFQTGDAQPVITTNNSKCLFGSCYVPRALLSALTWSVFLILKAFDEAAKVPILQAREQAQKGWVTVYGRTASGVCLLFHSGCNDDREAWQHFT